ncbi:MAG TPA: AAA family ATPase [Smithella sp.]|nr:AAA family ATPase [Smithella sp.]
MNYYNILNLKKEPFSNSPEPEFLFQLPQHSDCLQKLELAVRLRRGINVVIGDIGTGKTTLCRKLIQSLSSTSADSTEIETHLLLDPAFDGAVEFLQTIALMLGIKDLKDCKSEWTLKERIKDYLFDKGVDEKRIVVLIIDEGQKIPENCLEILREFLNYETNKFKLLQIIIFAQKEFQTILKRKANLLDRVNILYHLQPLNFRQMRAMVNYRLSVARDFETAPTLFSFLGFAAMYMATGGYPRRVIFLCHHVVLKMIVRGQKRAGWFLVRSSLSEMATPLFRKLRWALASILIMAVLGISIGALIMQSRNADAYKQIATIMVTTSTPAAPAAPATPVVTPATPATAVVPEIKQAEPTGPVANAPVAGENKNQNVKMPDNIGSIPMTKRRTLWWTMHNIYGDVNSDITNAVFAANPRIKDKDRVTEGSIITLPSIPAAIKPIGRGDIIVAIKSGKDLETMYNIYRNNPDERKLPPLMFLSYWNKKEGMEFAIVIDKSFNNKYSAEEAVGKLPPVIAAKAKILAQWDADTVFFNRQALRH